MVKIIIGVLIVAFVVIGSFLSLDPRVAQNSNSDISEVDDTHSFTIEWEISKEGTYKVVGTVTMSDLIEAAGGVTSNADELAYFDDVELEEGNTYYIPPKYDVTDVCSNKPIVKVNINENYAEDLTEINGITSAISNSIVTYRSENGSFETIEELMEVYGIGNATYRKIRNYVTLK